MVKQQRVELIDGFDLGIEHRTGIYVINERDLTIVETGPSPSVQHIREGLKQLGRTVADVKYIIVTHIHLDHAGGAGLLLKECPDATVVVHARGARHLAQPERLIAGAKAVYGDKFDALFDPILPIPEERLLIKGEGDTLTIGEACTLQFWDTPGHSNHHLAIYDPVSNGMFTGDTVGIRYEQLIEDGVQLFLPSTSPNQFNAEAMQHAIDRMRAMNLDYLYFGHYGYTTNVEEALNQVEAWLPIFVKEANAVYSEGQDHHALSARLFKKVQNHLQQQNISKDHAVFDIIKLDMDVSSMGLMEYVMKQQAVR
ncbi:MBL fold metallo-hydrolase [Sporosarcina ureilytica]|uniref:MBL fold metallo-hydrolase n=1 Tax=Sporosarcina ureilytica TaxID=298596 RepID=A0A1D8JG23_9BACL|nr:MBL fold metallo-hydrolase [Sporosarcina ureilytica]AOV07653.1 MBL fold metallo-hydrolase [Sporosarcina ureilytica]